MMVEGKPCSLIECLYLQILRENRNCLARTSANRRTLYLAYQQFHFYLVRLLVYIICWLLLGVVFQVYEANSLMFALLAYFTICLWPVIFWLSLVRLYQLDKAIENENKRMMHLTLMGSLGIISQASEDNCSATDQHKILLTMIEGAGIGLSWQDFYRWFPHLQGH